MGEAGEEAAVAVWEHHLSVTALQSGPGRPGTPFSLGVCRQGFLPVALAPFLRI